MRRIFLSCVVIFFFLDIFAWGGKTEEANEPISADSASYARGYTLASRSLRYYFERKIPVMQGAMMKGVSTVLDGEKGDELNEDFDYIKVEIPLEELPNRMSHYKDIIKSGDVSLGLDSINYAVGFVMSSVARLSSKKLNFALNKGLYIEGIVAALSTDMSNPSDVETFEIKTHHYKEMLQSLKKEIEEAQLNSEISAEDFLEQNKKRKEVKTTKTGLQYEIIEKGSRKKPKKTNIVECKFVQYSMDGEAVKTIEPEPFRVADIIKGVSEALQMMQEGAKWKLYVPSNIGYDDTPVYILEVELLEIK